jgi:cold shock CspA family protein
MATGAVNRFDDEKDSGFVIRRAGASAANLN